MVAAALTDRRHRGHRYELTGPRALTFAEMAAELSRVTGRAIGYRRTADGRFERADSYEDERFYGSGNLSLSASQLALWGTQWWRPPLTSIRAIATAPATIAFLIFDMALSSWGGNYRGVVHGTTDRRADLRVRSGW